MKSKPWSRQELIVALNLYLKIPFGKIHHSNPQIIPLAEVIGRSANAVSMRLSNFASVDPYHQHRGVKGLVGGKKQVQPIWDEFINNKDDLLFESERILADFEKQTLEKKYVNILSGTESLRGKEKVREVKTRINQNTFREIVLANYSGECAITNINISKMLIASHIIPWSKNKEERLNPSNGICLSAHFDKAFDKGLITFDENNKLVLSSILKEFTSREFFNDWFKRFEGKSLNSPTKYWPNPEFLEWHRNNVC